MLNTVWEDVKQQYASGNVITKLLLTNVVIFLFFRFLWLIMFLVQGQAAEDSIFDLLYFFSMSSDGFKVIIRPWTLITNMFLHFDLWHLLWNLLYLYWFGRILQDLIGRKKILAIYIISGLAGALSYFIAANLLNMPIGN